jgi:cysteine synthase
MQFCDGIVEAIGNTPLIKLKQVSAATGCTILGKAEFMNPGQSVKDRAALFIIQDAVKQGALKPGGVIVEGTAGNTGIGLALVGNALGFRSVIVIPETQSQEKKDTLRLCGAELVEVPAVPFSNPNNYVKLSGRLAEQLAKSEKNGAIWANQFDNVANRQGHVETTGPEIWRQTEGKVDGFVCAVGTGGTLAGIAIALKSFSNSVRIALADPMGAALYSYYTTGTLKSEGHRSPKASAKAASPKIWKAPRSILPIRFRTKKRCRSSSTCSNMKGFASAAPPASMSPARCAWRRSWDPATPS